MKSKLRSPSLFWTFAGAFLGVALLGTFLQGFVIADLLRTLARRTSGLDVVVRRASSDIAAALERSPDTDITVLLTAVQADLDDAVIAYRDLKGQQFFGTNVPRPFEPGRRHSRAERGGRRPPPGIPLEGSRLPPRRGHPPRGSPAHRADPPFEPPVPHDGSRIVSVAQEVVVGDVVRGVVVAWELGPPGPARISPRTRFLWSLPLALVLASVAGLLLFRNMLGRLRTLEGLAGRVAAGDLDVRVAEPGADEIGGLGRALNRMTEKLADAKRSVERSDQERRRLFADISHELATPLTAIRGYAETLLDPAIPISADERARYLRHIEAAGERMDLLLQDLLELTRLEAGAIAFTPERIDFAALCRNTVEAFAPRFSDAGIALRWEGPTAGAWIQADGRRMEQVIDNLLVNALRYVPRGCTVTIDMIAADGRWRLIVADDGPGFPPHDLPHVFDRFYRGDNAGGTGGSGLGLAIVQEIVRRHGGGGRAANRAPHGAVIEVELPAASATPACDSMASPSGTQGSSS